jgi:N-acetylmuramic acid 6-phosphate etherase
VLRLSEQAHPAARGLEEMPAPEALALFLDGHRAAVEAVRSALPELAQTAELLAGVLAAGRVVAYAGAGSSALMALADALELPGTFGIDPGQVRLHMAGGLPGAQAAGMPGDTEDDAGAARAAAQGLGPGDLAVVLAASGSTPYALAFRDAARAAGARVVGIANTAGAPLLRDVDLAVCLPTPPEMIAGSTRLGAGTAQKVALNLISSLAGVILGHVHDGLMVNLRPDNIKLRERAARIVAAIGGCDAAAAEAALAASGQRVKPAVLIVLGAGRDEADRMLDAAGGRLRAAIPLLRASGGGD